MHATEIETHKDVRNEWGSRNYAACIPGCMILRVASGLEQSPDVQELKMTNRGCGV